MSSLPTFFFSHARQDSETPGRYLYKFFEGLELELAQWAGVDLRANALGTLDRRVPHGSDWDTELSGALAKNCAFVAILTPLYVKRPNCGKELGVFLLRSQNL